MLKVLELLEEQKQGLEGQDYDYLLAFDILEDFYGYDNGYSSDILREVCDSQVDIYNDNLIAWLKDNVDIFENYINDNGLDNNFDLYRKIMEAQFDYYYHDIVLANENNFLYAYMYNFILVVLGIEEITEEQNDNLIAIFEEFEELGDIINEIKFRLGLTKEENK
jgi:hypothetical protein